MSQSIWIDCRAGGEVEASIANEYPIVDFYPATDFSAVPALNSGVGRAISLGRFNIQVLDIV